MTERGLPIADGAPACPFVAFEDDRDERATSPDHRHRCYAETHPAPRALAHQEAYCLSSAFPVCPTFQDWARREAARSRAEAPKPPDADGESGMPQRNPPRNWAAPPPWMSRRGRNEAAPDSIWADGDERDPDDDRTDDEIRADVPRRGRGLLGSYADRVASDSDVEPPGSGAEDADFEAPAPTAPGIPAASAAPMSPVAARPGWDDNAAETGDEAPRPIRRREREPVGPPAGPGRAGSAAGRAPAPEWERAKPLEAYPTLRSRRLPELSVPPILVAVVAIALAAAVLFALPGLLGFGNPGAGASSSPKTPVITPLPSLAPTPVPQPTPTIYVVKAGDTLSGIAGRFGIPLQTLIDANAATLPDPDKLQIGDQLIIPTPLPTELPAASEIPAAS